MSNWTHPTPHEQAEQVVDEFMQSLEWRMIRRPYYDERRHALHSLRLKFAAEQIRSTIGQPPIPLA